MQQIEDLTLLKLLGKGSFGEVYLSTKKGKPDYFATKKIDRKIADKPGFQKYLNNEIKILTNLNHPNIVKLIEVKKTQNFYYIVTEYINGGGLSDCLKKYMKKYNKAFSEEIVQYLMNQIIEALNYIHSRKIIHRDLKLDNIMINFDTQYDKHYLNIMKAKVKIIDFGFAIQLKNDLTYSAVGSPINMDPIILKKFSKNKVQNNLGYDEKADIWSIGTVCYELLIGKAVFNAKTLNDLVEKVENGSYSIPNTVSKEVVSFLNGMLQYDPKYRLSSEELLRHRFLTKKVKDFTRMDTVKASKDDKIKKNKSIWAIFNDEDKYVKIQGGKNLPTTEGPYPVDSNHKNNNFYKNENLKTRRNSNQNHLYSNKNNNINDPNIDIKKAKTLKQLPNEDINSFLSRQSKYPNNTLKSGNPQFEKKLMTMTPMRDIQRNQILEYQSFEVPQTYQNGIIHKRQSPDSKAFKENIPKTYLKHKSQNVPSYKKPDDDICCIY